MMTKLELVQLVAAEHMRSTLKRFKAHPTPQGASEVTRAKRASQRAERLSRNAAKQMYETMAPATWIDRLSS